MGFKVLLEDTKSNSGLQGVTMGYNRLLEVTGSFKVLQVVTRD